MQYNDNKQLSYRRETALQGGLVIAKSGRLKLEDNIYGHYRFIFNHCHCDVFGQQRNRNRRKKHKIKAITPFEVIHVIEVGTNRKPVCDFLLVINSN